MAKLTIFHLENCPYCKKAEKALAALTAGGAYNGVEIEWIEERKNPAVAEQYDYYYVPTMFFDHDKQYEAHPGESYEECRENIRKVFEAALA